MALIGIQECWTVVRNLLLIISAGNQQNSGKSELYSRYLYWKNMFWYFDELIWEKIVILRKKDICMANKTVKIKVLIFIMGICIKIVKLCVLENSPVNIVSMYIKRSTILKCWWIQNITKIFIILSFIGIKNTWILVCIWG